MAKRHRRPCRCRDLHREEIIRQDEMRCDKRNVEGLDIKRVTDNRLLIRRKGEASST
jgi:hypothetical protein